MQAKTKARPEPRRGQKRESTQLLIDLEVEVTSTVPVVSGSASIQGGSRSSMDVLVDSCAVVSTIVEDIVPESRLPILVQLDRCTSMKARPHNSRN